MENFVPIKLAGVLRKKLEKRNPYCDEPEMEGLPFVLAVQDFSFPRAMQMITSAMTEYVFGVRQSIVDGRHKIEWIDEHVWGKNREKSGFFNLSNVEHISAVMVNPQGTLPKFNRMGFLGGVGNMRVQMARTGIARGERKPENPMPKPFLHKVHEPGYSESWVEGMVVLHNPRALIPFPSCGQRAGEARRREARNLRLPRLHVLLHAVTQTGLLRHRAQDDQEADGATATGDQNGVARENARLHRQDRCVGNSDAQWASQLLRRPWQRSEPAVVRRRGSLALAENPKTTQPARVPPLG